MTRAFFLVPWALLVAMTGTQSAAADDVLRIDGALVRWVRQPADQSLVVTYAALTGPHAGPSGRRILSPDNCSDMHALADVVGASPGIPTAEVMKELRAAFATWERVAAVTFVEVNDVRKAQIIVGASFSRWGRAFANISYVDGTSPRAGDHALGEPAEDPPDAAAMADRTPSSATIAQAFICLNPAVRWKIGFDGNLNVYDLRYTFTHEIGHAIGLDHPAGSGALMSSRYDERVQQLRPSDILAAQRLYGPPRGDGE